jgi:hypothetical protein
VVVQAFGLEVKNNKLLEREEYNVDYYSQVKSGRCEHFYRYLQVKCYVFFLIAVNNLHLRLCSIIAIILNSIIVVSIGVIIVVAAAISVLAWLLQQQLLFFCLIL